MIVDISRKPDVFRYARASAEVVVDRCNTAVAAHAARFAHRYLPFLHPLPLSVSASCKNGRLYVEGSTEWQTGVEMDVLFGVLVGAVSSGVETIKNIVVEVKTKGGGYATVDITQLEELPLVRNGDVVASAYGEMELKSLDLVKKPVDKGHPIYAAQTAAALNVKRLCELMGGPCPSIQSFKIDIDVRDILTAVATVKSRDVPPGPEALFAVGVAFLTIWDMVKKWEKDERGQYPYTKIRVVSLR